MHCKENVCYFPIVLLRDTLCCNMPERRQRSCERLHCSVREIEWIWLEHSCSCALVF